MGILLVIKVLGPKAFYSNSSGGLLLLVSGRKIITRPLIKKRKRLTLIAGVWFCPIISLINGSWFTVWTVTRETKTDQKDINM